MEMAQSQQALVFLAKLSEAPWELCKQRQRPSMVQDLVSSSIFFYNFRKIFIIFSDTLNQDSFHTLQSLGVLL